MTATPFWFRHEPAFCITGALFAQPVQEGRLRDEWMHSDCASLDAPEYICTGGIRLDLSCGGRYASELTMLSRDTLARNEAWHDDDGSDWGDAHYWADADLHDMHNHVEGATA